MTELETKLIALLQASESESKQRESHFLEQVSSLQQRLDSLTPALEQLRKQQQTVMSQYNEISQLLAEELQP